MPSMSDQLKGMKFNAIFDFFSQGASNCSILLILEEEAFRIEIKGVGLMFERIMMGVDFSPYTEKIVACSMELSQLGTSEILLFNAIDPQNAGGISGEAIAETEAALSGLLSDFSDLPVKFSVSAEVGKPAAAVAEKAKEENVSMIILGAHGKGFIDRFLLGSVSERVVKLSEIPVMVFKCKEEIKDDSYICENVCKNLRQNILITTDFSKYVDEITPALISIVEYFKAPVTLLHVDEGVDTMGYDAASRSRKQKIANSMEELNAFRKCFEDYCTTIDVMVVKGTPSIKIIDVANEIEASLIVMGTFGNTNIISNFLGGVTEKVLRKSEVPVLVV